MCVAVLNQCNLKAVQEQPRSLPRFSSSFLVPPRDEEGRIQGLYFAVNTKGFRGLNWVYVSHALTCDISSSVRDLFRRILGPLFMKVIAQST